ncbi:MAG: hypothetical protein ACXAC2_17240, partial [Candidatus Kariarchaeaceae archaeon]
MTIDLTVSSSIIEITIEETNTDIQVFGGAGVAGPAGADGGSPNTYTFSADTTLTGSHFPGVIRFGASSDTQIDIPTLTNSISGKLLEFIKEGAG